MNLYDLPYRGQSRWLLRLAWASFKFAVIPFTAWRTSTSSMGGFVRLSFDEYLAELGLAPPRR